MLRGGDKCAADAGETPLLLPPGFELISHPALDNRPVLFYR